MNKVIAKPKHIVIADHVRELILSGRVRQGDRLQPDTTLATAFHVNKATVANGMSLLVAEGLISRTPGRGSVVIRSNVVERAGNMVGIVSHSEGDFYSAMAAEMTEQLLKRQFYPVWITQSIFHRAVAEPNYKPFLQMLEHLLNDCPQGLIIRGERFIPLDMLQRNIGKIRNLVFCCDYLAERRVEGAAYVLIDHRAAIRELLRMLAQNNHRKFTFLAMPQRIPAEYGRTVQNFFIDTCRESASEFGLEFSETIPMLLQQGNTPHEVIAEKFPAQGITAALLPFDSVWQNTFCSAFRTIGVEAPRDLSLAGYYNTPWSQKATMPLTSVNVHEMKIAHMAVETVLNETSERDVLLPPEIIDRGSILPL